MRASLLVVMILLLSACYADDARVGLYDSTKPLPAEIERVVPNEDRACSVIYHGKNIWIIEQHCVGGNKQGLYLGNTDGVTRYEWFDEPFNTWVGNEGCNTKRDCYYEVEVDGDGRIMGFTYRFYINLSEGYYRVGIKNGELVVLEKSIVDHPS